MEILKSALQRFPVKYSRPIGWLFLVPLFLLGSCYSMRSSNGGGQIKSFTKRPVSTSDISVSPGYVIEVVSTGLTFPTAMDFDDAGVIHVVESGYVYGEMWLEPKLIRIDENGNKTTVARGDKNGPWNGLAYHEGSFYVAEGGQAQGGKILRISPDGKIQTLVEGLPSIGDHHTNELVVKDGYIYFGQGTATNSAIVGEDNADFGWMKRNADFHDIPCRDIVLTGQNFESSNVLTDDDDDKISTGAYSAFGTTTSAGQIIKGSLPCTGAIMRIPLEGGKLELVAWGLRNPFGLAMSADGKLYTTENSYDDRGSRPVWGTGDVLWEVKENVWYGWPDFAEGNSVISDKAYMPPSAQPLKPLLQQHPNVPPKPVAVLGVHSSANGFDFSTTPAFGFESEAFIALFGDMAPNVGKVLAPVGFKVVRVDLKSGVIRDFAVNKGKTNGPASWLKTGGLERPIEVRFSPDGGSMYIVDFGVLQMTKQGPAAKTETGVIWRVKKK